MLNNVGRDKSCLVGLQERGSGRRRGSSIYVSRQMALCSIAIGCSSSPKIAGGETSGRVNYHSRPSCRDAFAMQSRPERHAFQANKQNK